MRLQEVTLTVHDLERSIAFYTNAVGLRVLVVDGATARLGAVGGEPALVLIERAGARPRGDRAGLFHVAWLLASRAHLGAALQRLSALEVPLTGAADHRVSEAIYLDDPEGNGIELYADRPESHWRTASGLVMTNSRLDLPGLVAAAGEAGIASDASAQGMRLGHVHLEASDLAASSRFAQDRLELELRAAWPNAHFLAWHGYHHHLAYNDWNRRRAPTDDGEPRLGLAEIALAADHEGLEVDPDGIRFVCRNGGTVGPT